MQLSEKTLALAINSQNSRVNSLVMPETGPVNYFKPTEVLCVHLPLTNPDLSHAEDWMNLRFSSHLTIESWFMDTANEHRHNSATKILEMSPQHQQRNYRRILTRHIQATTRRGCSINASTWNKRVQTKIKATISELFRCEQEQN